jgi:hypothetical protein
MLTNEFDLIVPIDTINIDKINVNNNKFTYNDKAYTDFELKILVENVELYMTKYNKVSIVSEQLMHILIELENKLNKPREKYYKYININFTKKSSITLIPTKASGKEQIMTKTPDEFIKQIKLYFSNKFNNISAHGNIIIIPRIITNAPEFKDYEYDIDYPNSQIKSVWFEIYFGEIFHSLCYVKNSMIFNNLYSVNNSVNNSINKENLEKKKIVI